MRARLFREWLLVAILATAFVAALIGLGLTRRADNVLYDLIAGLRSPLPTRVTIIAIDEASLGALGRWPWPRTIHARLLARLGAARPAAIGYDVLFVEPAAGDAILARALAATRRVVLPMTFSVPGEDGAPFAPQLPVASLLQGASVGHAVLLPDEDGIVRGIRLLAGDRTRSWPAFAEMIHRQAYAAPSAAFLRAAAEPLATGGFGLSPELLVPTTQGGHPTVPFASVLRGEVPPELLRGRILLVGSTAVGSGDRQPVPGGALPGVEVIADVLDALTQDRVVRPVRPAVAFACALLPLAVLLAGLLRLSPRTNLLLGAATLPLLLAASAVLLLRADLWVPPSTAMAGVMLVHPLWAWRRLAATSAYILRELGRLQAEPDPLPLAAGLAAAPGGWLDDVIGRQRALLESSVKRVRDLRRFFADSLQGLPDATMVVDGADRVLLANRAAEQLFGAALRNGASDDAAALISRHFSAAAVPVGKDGDIELTTADARTFMLRRRPFTASTGETVGAILSFVDLTTVRLAMRQREEALRLLSHDMRAPQAAILALIEQGGDAETRDRIGAYARRTIRLAEEFVLLTRAEAALLDCEILNLAALLVEAADELWPLAQRKQVRVEAPDEAEEFLVFGDRSLLLRMFINLIDNAIRYGPPGSTIRCGVAPDGADYVSCIADDGPGIPDGALDAIFRPFERAGRREKGGTGLGLAFVRTVATRHGGDVTAANAAGGGAVLSVRLPAVQD